MYVADTGWTEKSRCCEIKNITFPGRLKSITRQITFVHSICRGPRHSTSSIAKAKIYEHNIQGITICKHETCADREHLKCKKTQRTSKQKNANYRAVAARRHSAATHDLFKKCISNRFQDSAFAIGKSRYPKFARVQNGTIHEPCGTSRNSHCFVGMYLVYSTCFCHPS